MILPNKIVQFDESIISKLPLILSLLEEQSFEVLTLYTKTKRYFEDINQFVITLDVLFVLGKVEIDKNSGRMKHAKKNYL